MSLADVEPCNVVIRAMTPKDYDAVSRLWMETEHLSMNECDTREGIELYLKRNPGLCFVALVGCVMAGNVLCGHDGRRGILRHLAVSKPYRKYGIARTLVEKALFGLNAQGIGKCNIFVEDENSAGMNFWKHMGWKLLVYDFRMMQKPSLG
jgi:ribosomal protein S18 acetylase RimI-like enzyme